MANISNVNANVPLLKSSYKNLVAMGEGAKADDFRMTFDEYPDLEYLVQITQLPAMKREVIESRGPHGVQFVQQGVFMNAQEVPITFKEVVSGKALQFLIDWVKNKRYVTATLALISESQDESNEYNTVTMEDCWIEMDGVDLSVDDGATLVKPAGTLHCNWASWLDDEQETLSWE